MISFLFHDDNLPPRKYPAANPPRVIAITVDHTYKEEPKKGANIFAPNNSLPITVAPSINERNNKYFMCFDLKING